MFQLYLYLLKIIQNSLNNWNLVWKERLTGININHKINRKTKSIYRLFNWFKFSRSKYAFWFIIWRWSTANKLQTISFANYRKKRLQYYDWWTIFFDQLVRNDLITYDSQLDKQKSAIKKSTEVNLKLSSNVDGVSNDENNFPLKFLLTNTQVSKLRKVFANNSSANIKLSKTKLHKIGQSGGFLERCLGPLLKTGVPLM